MINSDKLGELSSISILIGVYKQQEIAINFALKHLDGKIPEESV